MEQSTTFLAIDTSTAVMAGAVMQDCHVPAVIQTEAERNHSVHIMTNIEAMLRDSGVKANNIDCYVVGIGPGSYTGVRIAVTAAKTLAWTFGKAIIKVSSLEALAFSALQDQQAPSTSYKKVLIAPIMDARRGQVYTASFSIDTEQEQSWQRTTEDKIVLMADWVDELLHILLQEEAKYDELWIAGDVHLHQEAIIKLQEKASIPVCSTSTKMNGEALAKLGRLYVNRPESKLTEEDIYRLAPNYAQLTEAEVKQRAKEREAGNA